MSRIIPVTRGNTELLDMILAFKELNLFKQRIGNETILYVYVKLPLLEDKL